MKAAVLFLQVCHYLAVAHAWTCIVPPPQHPAKQIDAGQGMVVMTDDQNRTFTLSGSTWMNLGTVPLKHVSAGPAGIWGADPSNKVYKYVAGDFVPSEGRSMQQVDAGGMGEVVGVSPVSTNNTFCVTSIDASGYYQSGFLNWVLLPSSLIYISCGPVFGCWGTDSANRIYVNQKVTPTNCEAGGWALVDGAANMVEVGTDGSVFVLNAQGSVYQRTGISGAAPQGTGWTQIPTCTTITHLTYDLGRLWLISDTGLILRCTQ